MTCFMTVDNAVFCACQLNEIGEPFFLKGSEKGDSEPFLIPI